MFEGDLEKFITQDEIERLILAMEQPIVEEEAIALVTWAVSSRINEALVALTLKGYLTVAVVSVEKDEYSFKLKSGVQITPEQLLSKMKAPLSNMPATIEAVEQMLKDDKKDE